MLATPRFHPRSPHRPRLAEGPSLYQRLDCDQSRRAFSAAPPSMSNTASADVESSRGVTSRDLSPGHVCEQQQVPRYSRAGFPLPYLTHSRLSTHQPWFLLSSILQHVLGVLNRLPRYKHFTLVAKMFALGMSRSAILYSGAAAYASVTAFSAVWISLALPIQHNKVGPFNYHKAIKAGRRVPWRRLRAL